MAHILGVLCLQANDNRKLVLMVQLVRRREVAEVKALMAAPETLEAALERVRQQVSQLPESTDTHRALKKLHVFEEVNEEVRPVLHVMEQSGMPTPGIRGTATGIALL